MTTPSSFASDLHWSLAPSNTSVAVSLLATVWPRRYWITTCSTTDQAGCDLLGLLDGRQPIGVDLKVRRGQPREEADVAIDVRYIDGHGQVRLGPMLREEPLGAAYQLHLWVEADFGILLNARRVRPWLKEYWTGLGRPKKVMTTAWNQTWQTELVFPTLLLLNECVGPDTARVLTLTPVCYSG